MTNYDPKKQAAISAGNQAEYDRIAQKYGAAMPQGRFINPAGRNNQEAWAFGANAEDPTQSNLERNAERRQNYYYGGSADYANNQQAALQRAQQASGGRFWQVGEQANRGMAAAQGREPGEFIDKGALSGANEAGGRQTDVYGSLMRSANAPQGPSAAQAQLQSGTNQALSTQLALARSGRGMGQSASALKSAQANSADIIANQANQSAMLRAGEDQAFRAQQLQALGAAGGVAGQQRGQALQTGAYTSGVKQAGQAQSDAAALGYGNMQLGAAQGGAQADLGYFAGQNQVASGVSGANQGYEDNLSGRYRDQRAVDAAKAGRPSEPGLGENLLQAGIGIGSVAMMASDIRAKKDIRPTEAANAFKPDFDMALYHNPHRKPARSADAVPLSIAPDDPNPALIGKSREEIEALRADIDKVAPPASAALKQAPASTYRYKNPAAVGAADKEYTGPMAQDLARTPEGRSAVAMKPDGTLGVDTGRLTLLNASAFGEQQAELERMRAEVAALKRARK